MPDLEKSLQDRDIGHLRIVARLWGVDLSASRPETAVGELSAALLDPALVAEICETLSAEARTALAALIESEGRMPWASFTRRFGDLRLAGPGRRDREKIYRNPVSAAEVLFYRALLGRAFFDTSSGAQEFAYVPKDLLPLLNQAGCALQTAGTGTRRGEKENGGETPGPFVSRKDAEPLGRPASPRERENPVPADGRLLDDATTILAALRMGLEPPATTIPAGVVAAFLRVAGILAGETPRPAEVKNFLEGSRPQALAMLAEAWRASETFNELRLLPGLICEGEWSNQPLGTREFVLDLLAAVPVAKWWSLPAFVRAVREKHPDFQRPAGDYDSWFIRRTSDGTYLRGFDAWDEVDGALVRFLIGGPLFWLGLVDLACAGPGGEPTAFLINPGPKPTLETGKLTVASNGRISVPRLVSRATRYLIARFCAWEDQRPDEYRYRVTTQSLQRANAQGLKVSQLLTLLAKNASADLPPAFVKALKRWEARGTEARVETLTVLRLSRPEVLEELRKSKAGRFLGEALGPAAVVVKPGAGAKVLAALAEQGLLAEDVAEAKEEGHA
ncbi:MAG: helicase-associated domain-containing protein [Anaerolineales bacterium]|nr:helicase-associated domain-containing protein [Anaerolineales bacterium]